ncbi:MAG: rod shape-determining protein RodA, partial [Pseudomonadales bacterium]|nr:rod shape-determining protein RodA [Pseudomonadales bacterium]
LFFVAQIRVKSILALSPWVYVAGVGLLAMLPLWGVEVNGARRWLDLPGLPRFQPSELMKLAVPLTAAAYLSRSLLPPRVSGLLAALLIIGLPSLLVVMQPDLGTSLLIGVSGLLVIWLAGIQWRHIVAAGALLAAAVWPLWQYVLHDYQRRRILTLFDPDSDRLGAGWNIIQSKTAIGSGGLTGKGWLNGTQSQLDFLPESHTDFIIAVLAEEFGLLGVLTLLILYLLVVMRGAYISIGAKDAFGRLVAGSITFTFFVYVVVNVAMVSGMLPVVGVPLPLVSYGGTSLVTLLAAFGILMSIQSEASPHR